MKPSFSHKAIILLFVFLAACQTETPTAIPSPTAIPTLTAVPISTPDPEIISPENASRLTLKWMNMGKAIGEPKYSMDGKSIYQTSTVGTYAFDTISYQDVHLLDVSPLITLTPNAPNISALELLPEYAVQPEAQETIFSPDGSLIAGYFHSGFTAVWRLADGKLINTFDGRPKEISPDKRLITVEWTESYETYTVYHFDLYDLQTSEQVGSWAGREAFFLSDNRLAVESSEGYTRIFDPVTRKVPHAFPGWYAAVSPDEQMVAVLYGNRIHIYRVSDGKLLQNLDAGLQRTDKAVLRFSSDGQILMGYTVEYYCCDGRNDRLFLWQVSDGRLLADLSRQASPFFELSPDGQTTLIGSQVLRTSDGSLIADLDTSTYFIQAVINLAFTPDGQQVIVLDSFRNSYLYPVSGTSLVPSQVADPATYMPILRAAMPDPYPEDQIDVPSPDKKFLARRDKGVVTILTWSGTGTLYPIPVYRVRRLAFSPDGQILALGLPDGSVVLWNVNSRQAIYTLPPRTEDKPSPVGGLAFSPDGKLLAIGLEDGTVRLFGIDVK